MHYSNTGRHQYETSLRRANVEVLKAYNEAVAAGDEPSQSDLMSMRLTLLHMWEESQLQQRPDRRRHNGYSRRP
jgi:hypothetical protein